MWDTCTRVAILKVIRWRSSRQPVKFHSRCDVGSAIRPRTSRPAVSCDCWRRVDENGVVVVDAL